MFQSLRLMPRNVWVLGFAALLTDASSEMIHSLLPVFLVTVLGTTATTVGLIEGVAESTASLAKVFSGALSDLLGKRKPIVVAGYGLSTLVKPLFALAQTPLWVVAARTTDRIGKGIRGTPRDALVADSVPPEVRGAAFGLRQSLDTVGAIIGPLVASLLMVATHDNFRLTFWWAVLPAVAAVLLLLLGIKEPAARSAASKGNPLALHALKRLGYPFWVLVAASLLFNLGNSSDAFLLLKGKQLGLPVEVLPLTMVLMNFTYALSAYPLGVISDRLGRRGLLLGGYFLYALIYAGFAASTQSLHLWLLYAAYGFYLGMSQGALSAMVADRVPADQRGTAYGFINLANGITLLPASLLAGALWDHVSPAAAFLAGSLFALLALLVLLLFLPDDRRGANS